MTGTPERSPIATALVGAAAIIAASAALAYASPAYVSRELGDRLLGALLGLVVVFYANAAPKALRPLTSMRCDPAAEQALRRFTGWALVIGGVGYSVASLAAPAAYAENLAIVWLVGAVLAVVARHAMALRSGTRVC